MSSDNNSGLDNHPQLCFLHIPKTAGTTLTCYLDKLFEPNEICPAKNMDDIQNMSKPILANYKFLRGHFGYDISEHLHRKPVYITMLRNPIERVISHYEYWKSNSEKWPLDETDPVLADKYRDHRKAISGDLLHFVTGEHPKVMWLANLQTWKIASGDAKKWPDTTDQKLLECAVEHLQEFIFVGIVEYFAESMLLLSQIFNFPVPKTIKIVNATPNRIQRKRIPATTLNAITERNQLDLILYEHAVDAFKKEFQSRLGRPLTLKTW